MRRVLNLPRKARNSGSFALWAWFQGDGKGEAKMLLTPTGNEFSCGNLMIFLDRKGSCITLGIPVPAEKKTHRRQLTRTAGRLTLRRTEGEKQMAERNTIYGFASQNEANKFRDILVGYFRPWVPGGLAMVRESITVEKKDLPGRSSYPWVIVHKPVKREIADWTIENFGQRGSDFVQGVRAGEKSGKKAAQETLIGSIKHPGLVKMARSKSPWTPDKKKRK